MLRTIAISLILVLSVGIMMPFANSAHGVRQSVQVKQRRHYRHRSRAWWRRYRARLRQKRAAAAELAAHRTTQLSLPKNISINDLTTVAGPELPNLPANAVAVNPLPAPPTPATSNNATRPRVVGNRNAAIKSPAAKLPGQMSLSVVALSRPNPAFLTSREESRMLAGVPVADLRRIVIDKMVAAGGWVTNDFVREVNGNRIFVVTARTPGDTLTPEKAWTFYFTEAGGRVYGLTTDTPLEFADRMGVEAERFIESLRAKSASSDQ